MKCGQTRQNKIASRPDGVETIYMYPATAYSFGHFRTASLSALTSDGFDLCSNYSPKVQRFSAAWGRQGGSQHCLNRYVGPPYSWTNIYAARVSYAAVDARLC